MPYDEDDDPQAIEAARLEAEANRILRAADPGEGEQAAKARGYRRAPITSKGPSMDGLIGRLGGVPLTRQEVTPDEAWDGPQAGRPDDPAGDGRPHPPSLAEFIVMYRDIDVAGWAYLRAWRPLMTQPFRIGRPAPGGGVRVPDSSKAPVPCNVQGPGCLGFAPPYRGWGRPQKSCAVCYRPRRSRNGAIQE